MEELYCCECEKLLSVEDIEANEEYNIDPISWECLECMIEDELS